MRYWKGSIIISEDADLPILRLAYRAGHLTIDQLYEALNPMGLAASHDSFNWRVRRLVNHGFLDRKKVSGLGDVMGLGESGELYLQGREPNIVERATRARGLNGRTQLWHDVDLFGIQLSLRRASVVVTWQSEPEVRAQNDFTGFGFVKDYDAVVTFRLDDLCAAVALEYERTAKSSEAYAAIGRELGRETRLSRFLYLVPSQQFQSFVLQAIGGTRRRIYIGRTKEFCADPRQSSLLDARTGTNCCFADCLRGGE